MLSKCSRSYTIQRIKAFPNLSTYAPSSSFVSTHDLPPCLGREVILAFSYLIHMFSAFAMLHWLSFLRLHIRDSFVLPSSSYRMVLFCFRHASSRPYVQHFHVASLVFLSRLACNSSFVLDVHHVLWFHLFWVGDRMGPVPYGPIMTSSAISKSPIWFQQASHNDVSKQ